MTGSGPLGITGAAGFVGSRLLPRLLEREQPVVCILRPGRDPRPFLELGAEIRFADLNDAGRLGDAFTGLDGIVHLAGLAQVAGMVGPLERAGVSHGVFVSSAGVYTRLPSSSAEAKRRSEEALRRSTLQYTIVRPSMIYGASEDRNMARLLRFIRRWRVMALPGGGSTLQQPVHVDDLVDLILSVLEQPSGGRREYDAGGPTALPLRDVVRLGAELVGRRVVIVPLPVAPSARLVELARRAGLPCRLRGEQILRLAESKAVDNTAAVRELGFRPRSLAEGLAGEAQELGWTTAWARRGPGPLEEDQR